MWRLLDAENFAQLNLHFHILNGLHMKTGSSKKLLAIVRAIYSLHSILTLGKNVTLRNSIKQNVWLASSSLRRVVFMNVGGVLFKMTGNIR
jgi:hypothetical protein